MNNSDNKELKKLALNSRKNILEMSLSAGASSSHFGGGLSIVEILVVLYSCVMKQSSKNPSDVKRDRLILSKRHGCLGLYSVLTEFGYIKKNELSTFEKSGSDLLGHPVMNKKKGIEFSTGSLGMGLSLGIGLSLASKKKKINFNNYVILGDGECNEGSVWEAAMLAPNLNLDNLTVIVDNNGYQQTGSNKDILDTASIKDKFKSFGWHTVNVDGHNFDELKNAFSIKTNLPKMICAKTIKGKGFSFSENNNEWHHKILSKNLYEDALKELSNNDN